MKSNIFILYTGGTFGMKPSPSGGLEPSPWSEIMNYLPAIKEDSYFNQFKDVSYTFQTIEPIIDSSDVTPSLWSTIAQVIRDNYEQHDGFVVIHGTDTMAYTASALSFVLENLNKPVVVTGAQLPIYHPRTDGIANLTNALFIAAYKTFGISKIPEVCICFNDDLLRGNRAVKSSTNDFEGFSSPNYPNLASLEQHIDVSNYILPGTDKPLQLQDAFSSNVVNVTIFPGYNPSPLLELVTTHKIKGIVLRTFGAGNIPSSPAWKDLFTACLANKIIILASTQCPNGKIELGQYSAGEALKSDIIVNGLDITPEAALTKLMWAIGNYSFEESIAILKQNTRGEISTSN